MDQSGLRNALRDYAFGGNSVSVSREYIKNPQGCQTAAATDGWIVRCRDRQRIAAVLRPMGWRSTRVDFGCQGETVEARTPGEGVAGCWKRPICDVGALGHSLRHTWSTPGPPLAGTPPCTLRLASGPFWATWANTGFSSSR